MNLSIDVIKDLIRYLKRDDDTHTIRCFLGRAKLLQTDLVKILIHHVNNTELWDVLIRYVLIGIYHRLYNNISYEKVYIRKYLDKRNSYL